MTKRIVTIVLALFALGSLGYAVYTSVAASGATAASGAATTQQASGQCVTVYYFHGNARCMTCRAIEAQTREAVQSAFASELASGRVRLETVNVEEPGNEHFVADFRLAMKTVVIARSRNGEVEQWEQMNEVWSLVRSPDEFGRYLDDGVRRYLSTLDA